MNQKDNRIKFEKSNKTDSVDPSSLKHENSQDKQEEKILKLMKKFNISKNESMNILNKLENKKDVNLKEENGNISNQVKQPQDIVPQQTSEDAEISSSTQNKLNNKTNPEISNNQDNNSKQSIENDFQKKDIDEIMSDLISDYDQQLSIEVDHVDLTFEVETDKIDTLKESFIRTIKRDKSKKRKIHALNDISFKIYKGEKVGIIGYNGAGKSTLLNVICGIYHPNKGTVNTYGNISPLLGLGAGFDRNYSGRKNIMLNGAVLGYKKEFLENKIDEIIEFSELEEFIDLPIKNYSSGMMAKLGFSIATAVEPDILVIDEILGVGDVNFAKKSRDKMLYLMDGGTTVLLVSHSIPQIRDLCDKAIWIDNGKVREIGEVNKVCDHYLKDAEKASNEQLKDIQFE